MLKFEKTVGAKPECESNEKIGSGNKRTALFLEAQAGNEVSLNLLVDLFYMDIYRMVYYRIGSDTDSQDITQEIFITMAEKLKSIKEPDKFKSWLFKIALNKVNDFHRKKRFLSFISIDSDEMQNIELKDHQNPEKDFMKKDFYLKLKQFTDNLSKMEKQVFTLRFLDQLDIKEIGLVLKKNESTIKTHLYRAVSKFKNTHGLKDLLGGLR
ncbi:MAG: RNA polymerase sigma factor [Nitrospirae bacterium]|nr:RNA polymerase sigma factor [Nitrospirota bacterium]